jgi:hypothetical protein
MLISYYMTYIRFLIMDSGTSSNTKRSHADVVVMTGDTPTQLSSSLHIWDALGNRAQRSFSPLAPLAQISRAGERTAVVLTFVIEVMCL